MFILTSEKAILKGANTGIEIHKCFINK